MPSIQTKNQITTSSLTNVDEKLIIRMNLAKNRAWILNSFGFGLKTISCLNSPFSDLVIRRSIAMVHSKNAKKGKFKSIAIDTQTARDFERTFVSLHDVYLDVLKGLALKAPRSYLAKHLLIERDKEREISRLMDSYSTIIRDNYRIFLIKAKEMHSELNIDVEAELNKKRTQPRTLIYSERVAVISAIKKADANQLSGIKRAIFVAQTSGVDMTQILKEFSEEMKDDRSEI